MEISLCSVWYLRLQLHEALSNLGVSGTLDMYVKRMTAIKTFISFLVSLHEGIRTTNSQYNKCDNDLA